MYYIGQSVEIETRYRRHIRSAMSGTKHDSNSKFHKALREYGIDMFEFGILRLCSVSDLNKFESYYIEFYDSCINGYNSTLGGDYTDRYIKLSYYEVENIIDMLQNTDISYQNIADEFSVSYNLVRYINYGLYHVHPDLTYPLRKKEVIAKIKPKCINCGCDVSVSNTHCSKCRYKLRIGLLVSPVKPSKDELKSLIRTQPFTKIGKDLGVSDNAVRKWCKSYNLPYRHNDIKNYSDYAWNLL